MAQASQNAEITVEKSNTEWAIVTNSIISIIPFSINKVRVLSHFINCNLYLSLYALHIEEYRIHTV